MRFRLFIWGLPELRETIFVGTEDELARLIVGIKRNGHDVTWELESTLRKLGLS